MNGSAASFHGVFYNCYSLFTCDHLNFVREKLIVTQFSLLTLSHGVVVEAIVCIQSDAQHSSIRVTTLDQAQSNNGHRKLVDSILSQAGTILGHQSLRIQRSRSIIVTHQTCIECVKVQRRPRKRSSSLHHITAMKNVNNNNRLQFVPFIFVFVAL